MPAPQLLALFRHPLIQFFVIGIVLFASNAYYQDELKKPLIVIDQERIEWLRTVSTKERGKPPTDEQLKRLVDNYIDDEIYYRQALALGLGEDDVIIRRRLIEKARFLLENSRHLAPATEEQLREFYQLNIDRFQLPRKLSFNHYYFSKDQRSKAQADAAQALKTLQQASPPASKLRIGDPFMLAPQMNHQSQEDIAEQFGEPFGELLFAQQDRQWQGPIASVYGWHLVYIHQDEAARPLSFEEARTDVLQQWRDEQSQQLQRAQFTQLKSRFRIEQANPSSVSEATTQ